MTPDTPKQPADASETIHAWFVAEVQPHDSSLKAYLRGAFPAVRDIDDVVQESYARLWKACATRPIRSARAFLFRVARHVAIDVVRRERSSPIEALVDSSGLQAAEEVAGTSDRLIQEEKIELLGQAVGCLPARCRQVILLHKIKGLSQREVAEQLGVSEKTVENQVSLGVKRCNAYLRKRHVEYY